MRKVKPGDEALAVVYIRASKDEQQLSPEAQRAACEHYAAEHGLTIAESAAEHLCSTTELEDRPELIRALGALRALGAGVLLVAKRDRLARDPAVAALIDRAVERCGAKVVCADGVANGEAPADRFMRAIIDAAAAYELAMIRARTKAALAVLRARGQVSGTVPLGYRIEGDRLVEDSDEAETVAEVRKLAAEGIGAREIARRMRAAGRRTKRGGQWAGETVRSILARAV